MKTLFNRYERKYLVTEQQKNELVDFLKTRLIYDPYSQNGQPYSIFNIYYDTSDFHVIRTSIAKPIYKEKLRLRCYTLPQSQSDIVYLEIKKKMNSRINKRRIPLSYRDAIDYIDKNIKPKFDDYLTQQIFNEIDYFIQFYKANPGALIRYQRLALTSEEIYLRITFDKNIEFIPNFEVSNLQNHLPGINVLENPSLWLMEIKSAQNFPLWLVNKLSSLELFSQRFSKYGKSYQNYLLGGHIDEHLLYKP
jgi:hypothetical protein